MRYLLLLLVLSCAGIATPALAQDAVIPDMKGFNAHPKPGEPGYMSPEEMEAEAQYVYTACDQNMYQKNFYSCECVSGSFLIQREKLGPFAPPDVIMKIVLESETSSCVNTPVIAANSYMNCMRAASIFRETDTDNEEYCQCVGNLVAKQFQKKAIMQPAYVQAVKSYASSTCSNPANRPVKKSANAAPDPSGINIPN